MTRRCKIEAPRYASRAQVTAIELDDEFRGLVPQPLGDGSAEQVASALADGLSEPLVVWNWQDRLILLVGYHLFPALRTERITFPVIEKAFASRAEARQFIVRYHLRHGLLSRLALSYFRGQRCLPEKQAHGGDRRSEVYRVSLGPRKTLDALAELYGVSRQTLRLDMELADAIDRLTAVGGNAVKVRFLARSAGTSRRRIVELARQDVAAQQAALRHLVVTGALPRGAKRKATLTVPRRPKALALALRKRLGKAGFRRAYRAMRALLRTNSKRPEAETETVFA